MAYIICEPCIGVKDTACVEVCPVDCIHPRKDEPEYESSDQLYINPQVCIDCGACESVCPVQAIYAEDAVPEKWKSFIKKNYEHYGLTAP
ncbi:MAG: 4Fe-4S binding protein [candidate division WOR-3 bacterium]